jgi:hypothetical protein
MERCLYKLLYFEDVFKAGELCDKIFCEDVNREWRGKDDFIKEGVGMYLRLEYFLLDF